MQTDYDRFASTIQELAIPAFFNNPLEEAKSVVIGNEQQGIKVKFNFDVNGHYESVSFV